LAAVASASIVLAALLPPGRAGAQDASSFPVIRSTLGNGLRVVMSPDTSLPVVSLAVYYDVGSRNETPGHSGFAHLFEHMMFQGSANVGKMEHFQLVNAAGGSANGTTNSDRTNYFETLPGHQLALGLWLEADRMRSLDISDENFENQRGVVINEYRQSYENQPYGLSYLRVNELSYGDYFPYANPTIGSVADLQGATREQADSFWQGWYGPNNAVLAIVGDFDPDEAARLVEEHFGQIPRRTVPAWTDPGFAGQTAERSEVMYDRLATMPAFFVLYHIPPARHADHYAVEMLAVILGDGESSRLYQLLVEENRVCTEVSAYTDDRRGPDLINIEGIVAAGHQPAEARLLVEQEIERVQTAGVTDREMTKARNRVRAHFVFGLETTLQRAQQLAEFELFHGDARLLLTEVERYLAVTPQQVQDAARRYLPASNRTVLDVIPGEPPDSSSDTEGEPGAASEE
jgi:predicted Zn-dependent peptidase